MIRSVPIPTTVSRMGCAPGDDCCSDCKSKMGRLGASNLPDISQASSTGLQCDSDGNCYQDGVLVRAPLTTGAGCDPGIGSCGATGLSNTTMYLIGAAVLIGILEITSRRK